MKYNKYVRSWLVLGCILIFMQIIIGGITRLTGSGLSITKWEIVIGVIPPVSTQDWHELFSLYKDSPQYKKINKGMSLSDFKFIFFWEYLHRLWARLMGLIFLLPFIFFLYKKWIDRRLIIQMTYVIISAFLAAIFGWIMVASGLVNRPWVNAYKLSIHLGIALLTYSFLFWAVCMVYDRRQFRTLSNKSSPHIIFLLSLLCFQLFFGAILSGMKAALFYPTWPDMNGTFFPPVLFHSLEWSVDSFIHYDTNALMPALIHVLHRNLGYIVFIYGIFIAIREIGSIKKLNVNKGLFLFIILLISQVVLGILTLVNTGSEIPLFFASAHQGVAILILTCVLFMFYVSKKKIMN